jgi:group I intron endonuclease
VVIYKVTNRKNGKVYVGNTTRTFDVRLKEHKRKTKTILGAAIREYGFDNFSFEEIESVGSVEMLNEREKYWIAFYDCEVPKGYNQCKGGDTSFGYHHKEISKHKMSEKKKIAYAGNGNPFYGKTHSEEAKSKMSVKRKGRKLSEEWKDKISQGLQKKVINLDTGEIFNSVKAAATHYGLKDTHITRVCKGKRKTTGGFRWSHYNGS